MSLDTADGGLTRSPDEDTASYQARFSTSWGRAIDIRDSGLIPPPPRVPPKRAQLPAQRTGTRDRRT